MGGARATHCYMWEAEPSKTSEIFVISNTKVKNFLCSNSCFFCSLWFCVNVLALIYRVIFNLDVKKYFLFPGFYISRKSGTNAYLAIKKCPTLELLYFDIIQSEQKPLSVLFFIYVWLTKP